MINPEIAPMVTVTLAVCGTRGKGGLAPRVRPGKPGAPVTYAGDDDFCCLVHEGRLHQERRRAFAWHVQLPPPRGSTFTQAATKAKMTAPSPRTLSLSMSM